MPYIRNVPDSKIRVAYKDVKLDVFIAIAPQDNLVLHEAFRNAYDCGSVTFRRLELEIREIDSPFIAKSKHRETKESENVYTSSATATTTINYASTANSLKENTSVPISHKQLNFESESESETELVRNNWKESKAEQLSADYRIVHDEVVALDAQIDELSRTVVEPPPQGTYRSIVCGNCHLRGHRAVGNRNNSSCKQPACVSYASCGQRRKHPEHFEGVKNLKKRRKQLKEELDALEKNRKNLATFESKTISAFTIAVSGRLHKAFPDQYDTKTAKGKIKLQKDIATIRIACNNKVPAVSIYDRSMFLKMLEKQQQSFEEIDNIDNILLSKGKSADVLRVTASPNCNNNSHSPTIASNCPIVNISSPISMKKVTKKSKRKTRSDSSSSSSDTSGSSSDTVDSSSASDLDAYIRRKHTHRSKRKHKRSSKGSKKTRKRRKVRSRRETNDSGNAEKMNTLEITNATRSDELLQEYHLCRAKSHLAVSYTLLTSNNNNCYHRLFRPSAAQHVDFTQQQALLSMYVPSAIPSTDADQSLQQDKEHNSGQVHAATLDDLANIALSRN